MMYMYGRGVLCHPVGACHEEEVLNHAGDVRVGGGRRVGHRRAAPHYVPRMKGHGQFEKHIISLVCLLSRSSLVRADNLWSGTWVLREDASEGRLTMTVEEVGTGWKLTHEVIGPTAAASTVSTVLTTLDGKEVPVLVNGRSSGQTMRIRKIDSHHTVAIMLSQGKGKFVSKSEISPDGKVFTVETDYTTSNPIGRARTQIEYWNRQ